MKSSIVLAIALAFGATGVASAGMQGQGTKPDAQKPEYKEQNPGDTTGKEEPAATGAAEQRGAAAKETSAVKAKGEKSEFGGAETGKKKPILPVKKDIKDSAK